MRYQIYEAKSVKYDAQQRYAVNKEIAPNGASDNGYTVFYKKTKKIP